MKSLLDNDGLYANLELDRRLWISVRCHPMGDERWLRQHVRGSGWNLRSDYASCYSDDHFWSTDQTHYGRVASHSLRNDGYLQRKLRCIRKMAVTVLKLCKIYCSQ